MHKATSLIFLAAFVLASCRGTLDEHPPIHLNQNMDHQERFDAQEANAFFEDNRSMRMPVAGTIARGTLRENTRFFEGRTESGAYVDDLPVPTTRGLLDRGQVRYDIFCTPCHGAAGDGQGIITTGNYGYTPAPTYHSDRLRQISDGYLYDVVANGIRNMPGYAHQIPVADRWAIVAYVRALQRSQYASESDVPASIRADMPSSTGGADAGSVPPASDAGAPTDSDAGASPDSDAEAPNGQPAGDNE